MSTTKELAHQRDMNAFRALGMLRSLRANGFIPASLHANADEIFANDKRIGAELDAAFAVPKGGTSLADDKHTSRIADGREAINDMLRAQGKIS